VAIAEPLADTTVTLEALDTLAPQIDGPALDAVLKWAACGCSIRRLASEIQDAATRISGLVVANKGFTHMDQAAVAEPVDLDAGSEQHGGRPPNEGEGQIGSRRGGGRAWPSARAWLRRRTEPDDATVPDKQANNRDVVVAGIGLMPQNSSDI